MFLTAAGSDVVVFVFMLRKFDDLPFLLGVNSSIFHWLESSFLRTFVVSYELSIEHGNYCRKFFEFSGARYERSLEKSAIFQGKFVRTIADFRRNSNSRLSSKFALITFAQYCTSPMH